MKEKNGNGHKNGSSNGNAQMMFSPLHSHGIELDVEETLSQPIVVAGAMTLQENWLEHIHTQTNTPEVHEQTEVVTGDAVQFEKIERAIHDLLDAFNVNWQDPNYTETPERVAKAYLKYWANGYGRLPENEITVFPNSSGSGDLVMVKDMQFYSTCSHHLAPFKGMGAIAYLPGDSLLGLSKLGRVLDIYARRFQLQERIGAQVADKIMELIRPQGVMVVLYDVEHMCMSSRGVQMHAANTTTMATRGAFKHSAELRAEVLSLLK